MLDDLRKRRVLFPGVFTDTIIRNALREDLGDGDLTTDAVVDEGLSGRGRIIAKETLIVAGLGVAGGVFSVLDPMLRIRQEVQDGSAVSKGTVVMTVEGSFRSLLKGERIALNFLQRLSGVATLTHFYVSQIRGKRTKILDTRKTTPTFRHLERYAVRMGGGVNHRFGLYDEMMVKDNHIAAASGSVLEAVRKAKGKNPSRNCIVEVSRLDQIEDAIDGGADRLLLDNMSDREVKIALQKIAGKVPVEISGGITPERVGTLSEMGVDFISVGALTHSARAVDLSFKIEKLK